MIFASSTLKHRPLSAVAVISNPEAAWAGRMGYLILANKMRYIEIGAQALLHYGSLTTYFFASHNKRWRGDLASAIN